MGKTGKKAAVTQAQANQKYYDEMVRDYRARTGAKAEQIEPFIKMLLGFGLDPAAFLKSAQGQAILSPIQQAIGKNFAGARESAVDLFAGQGFSPSAGVAQGPLANLFSQEAGAQSNAVQQLIAQSLGLGMQGAQLAQGQQQIFNPLGPAGISLGYNANIFKNDPSNTLDIIKLALGAAAGVAGGGLGGAGGSTLGGLSGTGAGGISSAGGGWPFG